MQKGKTRKKFSKYQAKDDCLCQALLLELREQALCPIEIVILEVEGTETHLLQTNKVVKGNQQNKVTETDFLLAILMVWSEKVYLKKHLGRTIKSENLPYDTGEDHSEER